MDYKIMVPSAVWQDYDAQAEPLEFVKEEGQGFDLYRFTAITAEDGDKVRVATKVYNPAGDATGVLLVVSEYHREPDTWLINDLVASGYAVVVPDISGIAQPQTVFPKAYAYGNYAECGDHIFKVMPTAKETCQYLYSIIIKRALVFINAIFGETEPVLIGLGRAVEVAMQVAGSGGKISGLACLNGSGYQEYIKLNKYGTGGELTMDEERMSWLSGVASVAYAKYVNVPVLVAIGTNSLESDIDRVANLKALVQSTDFVTLFTPKARDYMSPVSYVTFKYWLSWLTIGKYDFPDCPDIGIRVSDDARLYVDVHCDPRTIIEKVKVYYSYGEYNHRIRCWQAIDGISIANGEYIASPEICGGDGAFFAFATVQYLNGVTLSSLEEYAELKEIGAKSEQANLSKIVFQPSMSKEVFFESFEGEVLPDESLAVVALPSGAKGVTCKFGNLKTYIKDTNVGDSKDSLLHIDLYSEEECEVEIRLERCDKGELKTYVARQRLTTSDGMFAALQFDLNDFKDARLMPLADWRIYSMEIVAKNSVVGNILFI